MPMNARRVVLVPVLAAALIALASPDLRADEGWSGSAHVGLAFLQDRGASVSSGGWIELLHSIASNASAGVELGYMKLPRNRPYATQASSFVSADESYSTLGVSAAFRVGGGGTRLWSGGSVRPYMLGTFGYYDLSTRIHILGVN